MKELEAISVRDDRMIETIVTLLGGTDFQWTFYTEAIDANFRFSIESLNGYIPILHSFCKNRVIPLDFVVC